MAKINFVLLSQPRCGTTFLLRSLSKNKDVFCDNELFNPNKIVRKDAEYASHEIFNRDRYPLDFFHKYFNSEFSKHFLALGFNFMFGHHTEILKKIIDNEEIRIIHLKRSNKLAQAASWFKALQTQEWACFDQTDNMGKKQVFHFDSYIQHMREMETLDFLFDRATAQRKNLIKITYLELMDIKRVFHKIASFLEVPDTFDIDILKKQGDTNIINRFSNKIEVINFLKQIKHEEWAIEN